MKRLAILLAMSLYGAAASAACVQNNLLNVQEFKKYCTEVAQYPRKEKLTEILQRVCRIALPAHNGCPDLALVKNPNNPLALALPDGIVLSVKALDACYDQVDERDGDARLAFLLGHELAHHGLKHIAAFTGAKEDTQKNENDADESGFIYAALAGYPVDSLLESKKDFFRYWYQYLAPDKDITTHGTAEQRAEILRKKLKLILDQIIYFRFGVRLAHFGKYEDALYFLERFQTSFADAETLNNLGYVHLQTGLQAAWLGGSCAEQAPSYCLPALLEPHSRAERLALPALAVVRGMNEEARASLRQAAQYFKRINDIQPDYAPAWLNGAVTAFYLEEPEELEEARRLAAEARKRLPDHPDLRMVLAVLDSVHGNTEAQKQALEQMRRLADAPEAAACEIYNAAMLLEKQGKAAEADAYWQRLAQQAGRLPQPWRGWVCGKHSCPEFAVKDTLVPVALPVTPGTHIQFWPPALTLWEAVPLAFFNEKRGYIYHAPDGSAEILALHSASGEYADLVVVKTAAISTLPEGCFKTPALYAQSEIWNCGHWSALVENGQTREIWVTGKH